MGIRIVTVAGSVRPGNYTAKALELVHSELRKRDIEFETVDLDSVELALPGRQATNPALLDQMRASIADATGIILATPEYHGSFSSVMKLFIENLGFPSGLDGKPVALLGVAAGQIGAIKSLEHLRSVCSHVGAVVLPNLVSVANVQKVFDEEGKCLDPAVEKRVRRVAGTLLDYINGAICPRISLEAMLREQAAAK